MLKNFKFAANLSVAVLGISVSGCSLLGSTQPVLGSPAAPRNCPSPAALAPTTGSLSASTPTVVLLSTPGVEPLRADISTVLAGATHEGADTYVGGISAENPPSASVVLKAEGNNESDRDSNLACKTQALQNAVSTVADSRKAPAVNVFDALLNVAGSLTGLPSKKIDVVLEGNVQNSVPPIDLSKLTKANIAQTVNQVATAGLLPSCKGWRVTVISTVKPVLRDFYNELFAHCGGDLVAWTPALATFPVTTGRLPLTDYSRVSVTRQRGKIVASLAGDVTFDTGTATLRPWATDALSQILGIIPKSTTSITVDGYTDNTGSSQLNAALSTARARSVAAWLTGQGVRTVIRSVGHGSAEAVQPNSSSSGRQANRRVTVTIYTTGSE